MSPLDAALRYAAIGWPVFPCRGKLPLTPYRFQNASTDAATIKAWWRKHPDALISVATGRESRVVVLDVDVKQRGPNGCDSTLWGVNWRFGNLIALCCSSPPADHARWTLRLLRRKLLCWTRRGRQLQHDRSRSKKSLF